MPKDKVIAGGIGGAVSTILMWVLNYSGVEVPAEVAGAFVTIVGFAASYLTTERE